MKQAGKVFIYPLRNAGDAFNHDLLNLMSAEMVPTSCAPEADLLMLGGLLSSFQDPKHAINEAPLYVWGTGFLYGDDDRPLYRPNLVVQALRGKLSKNKLSNLLGVSFPEDLPLADPGLLASYFAIPNVEKKYAVGFIPHFREHGSDEVKQVLAANQNLHFIDITRSPREVIRDIQQCDAIISSSLHGLVFSDSLGIPNCHVRLTEMPVGGSFKFRDYYSAFNLSDPALTMEDVLGITCKEITDNYAVDPHAVEEKKLQLIEAFPGKFRQQTEKLFIKEDMRPSNPKVSVIIPVYNTENYLRECLDSVVNQTLRDFEIICVDDGSTDGSLAILREYEAKDSRVRVFTQERSNAGAARNNGLSYASGAYCIFLDSDDFFDTGLLEKTYEKAIADNADIVAFHYYRYHLDGTTEERIGVHKELLNRKTNVFNYRDCPDRIMSIVTPTLWTKLYRTAFIRDYNLKFEEISSTNDITFASVSVAFAERIAILDEHLVYYRVGHGGTISSTKNKQLGNILIAVRSGVEQVLTLPYYSEIKNSAVRFAVENNYYAFKSYVPDFTDPVARKFYTDVKAFFNTDFFNDCSVTALHSQTLYDYFRCIRDNEYLQFVLMINGNAVPKSFVADNLKEQKKGAIMRQPKVSVIIPVYNTEKYLRECLDSVVNQTLEDIEIICVDDGSTDGSLAILREYEEKDSRVIVSSQENRGQSAARNVAMQRARGKYLFFLDSDDYLETAALERMVMLAEEEELDVVVCGRTIHYERNDLLRELASNTKEQTPVQTGIAYMREAKNRRYYSTTAITKLVLRKLVEKHGITFPEGMIHEDTLFMFLVFMAASRVVQIPDELYGRRIREGSTMTTPVSHKNVHGYFGGALGMLEYASHGPYEPDKEAEIWRAIEDRINRARKAYQVISEEERTKLIFSKKRESVLFQKLIADNYLSSEAATQKKEADTLRQELEQQKQRADTLRRDLDSKREEADTLRRDLNSKQKEADTLRRDLDGKQKEADTLRCDLAGKKKEADMLRRDLEKQNTRSDTLQYDLDCVHRSVSFRVGRAITWLPRKLRGGVRCFREHGALYTVRRTLYHMGLWKDEELK